MTSATERLRALLDKRGVEHIWKFDGNKMWDSDGKCYGTIYETQWESPDGLCHLTFTEYPNKERTTRLVVAWHPTPEQAVAATLGPGTCHSANVTEYAWDDFECSECGWVTWNFVMEHEGCGTVQQPRYCPNCGRRVVE